MILRYLLVLLFVGYTSCCFAQSRLNFGEAHRQKEAELPKSRVPFLYPERKAKRNVAAVLEQRGKAEYLMRKGWELGEAEKLTSAPNSLFNPDFDTRTWYNATVPGTVLTTLVNEGVYPDPYFGVNNLAVPDSLCRMDWWYRLVFDCPAEQKGRRSFLILEGINYRAEVWLNGALLGKMNGAFVKGRFETTKELKVNGKNVLAVRIFPPANPGIPQEQNRESHGDNGGVLCLDGPTFICTEGWDWMPGIRDRNIGIWQDVCLSFADDIFLKDWHMVTDLPLPDTTRAALKLEVRLGNAGSQKQSGEVEFSLDGLRVKKAFELEAFSEGCLRFDPAEEAVLNLKDPLLWWPNGYGQPNLYEGEIKVKVDGKLSDSRKIRFGIRELEYEFALDMPEKENVPVLFNPIEAYRGGKPVIDNLKRRKAGNLYFPSLDSLAGREGITELQENAASPYLVVRVNGKRIFCRGGNWGMDEAMKRVSRERLEPAMRLHREQGFNMIRNWTAESTEEVFYELCDEYGLLVFNDFSMSTEGFNLLPADFDLFLENVKQIVLRYRNHPSVALWCPRNEGFAPEYLEKGISSIISSLDGTRHYIGNSRTMNTVKSGPWQYILPSEYFKMAAGFASEVGSPSLPTAESMRKMMAEEDLWPIGDVWYYHDWLMGKWGDQPFIQGYWDGINCQYGPSSGVDEFCRKAQLVNYESYRAIFEGWNSRLFHSATGVLLWMSHPAWPSLVWQTYSWDYETAGAYFGAKKACEPIHIQWNPLSGNVEVVNTSLREYSGLKVQAACFDLRGKKLREQEGKAGVISNEKSEVFTLERDSLWPGMYFIRLRLEADSGRLLSENFYWTSHSGVDRDFTALNQLPVVRVRGEYRISAEEGKMRGKVIVQNPTRKVAFAVKLNVRERKSGKAILPAYFSDGYFTLLPHEKKEIEVEFCTEEPWQITAEGYNVKLCELEEK